MQSEKSLKTVCLRNIKKFFPNIYCIKISDKFLSGVNDIIICCNSKFIGIELKTCKGKTTPIQDWHIKRIIAAGGVARVCRSWDEVRKTIEEVIANVSSK